MRENVNKIVICAYKFLMHAGDAILSINTYKKNMYGICQSKYEACTVIQSDLYRLISTVLSITIISYL